MKRFAGRFISLFCSLLIIPVVFTQPISVKRVPLLTMYGFQVKFPKATGAKWEKEGDNYEASFKLKGASVSSLFDAHGAWIQTEIAISKKILPEAVKAVIASDFKKYPLIRAEESHAANKDVVYEAVFKKNKKEWEVQFDEAGNILKK